MDLAAIRADLAVVAQECGLNAWDYPPSSLPALPAAVVHAPRAMKRKNRAVTEAWVPITFYASNAAGNGEDATRLIDRLLSTNVDGSFIDNLDSKTDLDGTSWGSIAFDSAEPAELVQLGENTTALACRIVLYVIA